VSGVTTGAADRVRRCIDVSVGCILIAVTAPIVLVAASLVATRVGRPVLFRQRRLGRGGRPFVMLKLRTMRDPLAHQQGPGFDAERTPRVGRLLRSTSIDELPSLVNLVRGDITLVGPRPLPVAYLTRYDDEQARRMEVRPGITGLAQVSGRNGLDWPERLAMDVDYVNRRSLMLDLRIVVRTVGVVVGRRGVDAAAGVTMTELPERAVRPTVGADRSA
jgi:lipopolysaccharide/colanic/teichoic acid biosynthesis glycosyltransferase